MTGMALTRPIAPPSMTPPMHWPYPPAGCASRWSKTMMRNVRLSCCVAGKAGGGGEGRGRLLPCCGTRWGHTTEEDWEGSAWAGGWG